MKISVVVPLYNEEDNVALLFQRIDDVLARHGERYEVIFVDDGSRDRSFELAAELAARKPQLKVIKFRRNYGQTPAMVAGISHATGDVVVTIDGDLQNDPTDIPLFLEKIDEGFDIVVGWRYKRQDKLITRKIPSRIANWLIGKVTGVPIKDNGCSLKAYKAHVIKGIPLYSEMHRFIPAMSSLAGTRVAEIRVQHHARQFGESKYGLSRIYKVFLDLLVVKTLLVSMGSPMRVFGVVGAAALLTGGLLTAVGTVGAIYDGVEAWLMLLGVGGLSLCLGVALLFLGILSSLLFMTGDVNRSVLASLVLDRGQVAVENGSPAYAANAGARHV